MASHAGLDGARLVHLRRLEQRHRPEAAPPRERRRRGQRQAAAPADEDAPAAEDDAPPDSEAARESEFEIWNGDPDEIVAASRKSWPPSEAKKSGRRGRREKLAAQAGKSSAPRAPPAAEAPASPVNAYWWTRKVLAENEVDLDDDHDLDDGKSRV